MSPRIFYTQVILFLVFTWPIRIFTPMSENILANNTKGTSHPTLEVSRVLHPYRERKCGQDHTGTDLWKLYQLMQKTKSKSSDITNQ
jgi:hypothetical protein